jgi:ATP-dependent helicase/nuclease subunit A
VASRSFDVVVKELFTNIGVSVFSLVQPGNFAHNAQRQIAYLHSELQAGIAQMNDLCRDINAVDDRDCSSDSAKNVKAAVAAYFPVRGIDDDGADPSRYKALQEMAEYFISSDSYRLSGKKPAALWEAAVQLKKDIAPRLLVLASTCRFRDDMLSLGTILDEYEAAVLTQKRQKGVLSFRDTAELAVEILKTDLRLRNYYKQHIKAIMIDEFQDNNALQKNLLYLIAEKDTVGTAGTVPDASALAPEKLFFVGDEKQSIYRFRGADVSVFRGLADELNNALSLKTNYRSTPELVAFYNALFPGVFGKAGELFEAEFSGMLSAPGKAPDPQQTPVEIYIQETGGTADDDDGEMPAQAETSEALAVASRILAGVARGDFALGDVAVLFRTTTHQSVYERLFRQLEIPFDAADPRGVFAEGPANDFYSLLRLVLFPTDRTAYAAVLRSPFVRLSDDTFFKIMLDNPEEEPVFPADPPADWFANATEQARYAHGRAVFCRLQSMIDVQELAPILAYLWYETGYRTSLLYDEQSRHNLEHFEHLYTLALNGDQRRLSVAGFLDELAPYMGTTYRIEGQDAPEQSDRVRFLTVHKSKGLEFKVVVLANAGSHGQGDRNDKPYYADSQWGVTINFKLDTEKRDEKVRNYFYEQSKEVADQQAEAELKRLFYVAATRARDKLLIFASYKLTESLRKSLEDLKGAARLTTYLVAARRDEAYGNSFLDLLSLGFAAAQGNIPHCRLEPFYTGTEAEQQRRIQQLRALHHTEPTQSRAQSTPAQFYMQPAPAPIRQRVFTVSPSALDESLAHSQEGDDLDDFLCEDLLDEASGEAPRRHFGTLCHYAIASLLGKPADTPDILTLLQKARSLFWEQKFTEYKLKRLVNEAADIALRFRDSPQGRETAGATFSTEFKFILPLSDPHTNRLGILVNGSIDLIYEYHNQCIIIDFKTDKKCCPDRHRMQMASYRAAAPAYSPYPARTILFYLRGMKAVPFDDLPPPDALWAAGLSALTKTP